MGLKKGTSKSSGATEMTDVLLRKLREYASRNSSFASIFNTIKIETVVSSTFNILQKVLPSDKTHIILVYIEKENTSSPFGDPCNPSDVFFAKNESINQDSNKEYLGCPLEAPFNLSALRKTIPLNSESCSAGPSPAERLKLKYQPLPDEFGQSIVNTYSSIILTSKTEPDSPYLPLFVLRDGINKNKIILSGTVPFSKKAMRPVVVKKIEGTITNGLPTFAELQEPKSLLSKRSDTTVTEKVESVYDFSSCLNKLYVECSFNDPVDILSPPTKQATCTLKVKLNLGETSTLNPLYKMVTLLRNAVTALETGRMVWISASDENMMSEVQKLVKATSEGRLNIGQKEIRLTADNDVGARIEKLIITEKVVGDFTAQLFTALQNCESISELQEALKYVSEAISKGEICPQLQSSNQTTLAKWICDVIVGNKTTPLNLEAEGVLRLLVEIGIDKLWNDYCAAYLELATLDLLKDSFNQSVDSLYKIHYTLELAIQCQNNLHLEMPDLRALVGRALKELPASEDYLNNNEISFSNFNILSILALLKKTPPQKWEYNIEGQQMGPHYCFRQRVCRLSQSQDSGDTSVSINSLSHLQSPRSDLDDSYSLYYYGQFLSCSETRIG